jgi:hypothetical protein
VVDILENVDGWRTQKIKAQGNARCFVVGEKEDAGLLEHYLGVRWIGPFTTIKTVPKWKWLELQQIVVNENGKKVIKYIIVPREEPVSEFFFQFQYPVTLENAEISGNIQVRVTAAFTVLHFHPVRAFFLNKEPTTMFNTMVLSALRDYVKDKTFNEVKAIKASVTDGGSEQGTFWQVLKSLNGVDLLDDGSPNYEHVNPLGVFGKLGDVIVRGEVLQVEAVGAAAEAIEAERLAELNGNAAIMEARKAANASVIAAQGRLRASRRDAVAQRAINEQNAGYFASLPGGARMFAANQVSGKDSKVTTWVESRDEVNPTLPLAPTPPRPPEPEKKEPKNTKK